MSGWPTPNAGPQNDTDSRWQQRREECRARHGNNGFGLTLGMASTLAGWSTASARDWEDTAGMATEAVNPDGSTRTRLDQLPRQAQMAGWLNSERQDRGSPMPIGSESAGIPSAEIAIGDGAIATPEALPMAGGGTITMAGWPTATARDGFPAHSEEYIAAKKAQGHGMANLNDLVMLAANPQPARFTASGQMLTGCSAGTESGGQLNPDLSRWLMGYPAEWGSCGATAMQSIRTRRQSSSGRSTKASGSLLSSAMIAWLLAA